MRTILLLRHAHAEPAADDFSRTLSSVGKRQVLDASQWLSEHPQGDLVALVSPSSRTKETFDGIASALRITELHHLQQIYEASVGQLMQCLERFPEQNVLLVGHNPGLESLLAFLCTGQSGSARGMSPGSLAILNAPAGIPIVPGNAKLVQFFSP